MLLLFFKKSGAVIPPVEINRRETAPSGGGPGVQIGLYDFLASKRQPDLFPAYDEEEDEILAILLAITA